MFIGRGPTIRDEATLRAEALRPAARLGVRRRQRRHRAGRRHRFLDLLPCLRLGADVRPGKGHGSWAVGARRLLPRPRSTRASHRRFAHGAPALLDQAPSRRGRWPTPDRLVLPITARSRRCAATLNWMAARQATCRFRTVRRRDLTSSGRFPMRASRTPPASTTRSNSSCMAATRCAHAVMMLIPEAWAGNPLMDEERRAFYEYHAALDGAVGRPRRRRASPMARQIGATLDRNGLRPARYYVDRRRSRDHAPPRCGVLADSGREDRHEVAPAAGQDAARSTSKKAASSRTRKSKRAARRRASPYRGLAEAHADRA